MATSVSLQTIFPKLISRSLERGRSQKRRRQRLHRTRRRNLVTWAPGSHWKLGAREPQVGGERQVFLSPPLFLTWPRKWTSTECGAGERALEGFFWPVPPFEWHYPLSMLAAVVSTPASPHRAQVTHLGNQEVTKSDGSGNSTDTGIESKCRILECFCLTFSLPLPPCLGHSL